MLSAFLSSKLVFNYNYAAGLPFFVFLHDRPRALGSNLPSSCGDFPSPRKNFDDIVKQAMPECEE